MANEAGALRDFYVEHDPVYADHSADFDGKKVDMYSHGMTRQEFREECDINTIMKKYETTGQLPQNLQSSEPVYWDTTIVPGDLITAMEQVQQAELAFMRLPASVRKEFDNNAMAFCDFAVDPANLEQMRKWGLAPPAVEAISALVDAPPGLVEPPPGA